MQDLRLIGVQDDGEHLLLSGADGEHYRLPLDDALRAAARRDRPRLGQLQIEMEGGMRPREVQSLIRAGATAEEVADRAGWTVEKVRRYEGPIIAERVHVAEQARMVRVRHRGGSSGSTTPPTLQGRVAQRMRERGVDPETNLWDSWRGLEETHWTVVLTFAAGGRQRQATWSYDPVLRSVEASDDEARWLSGDEPAEMGPLPTATPRTSNVYDVEAEGGVAASIRRPGARPRNDEPLDLMTAMRERTTVGRRSGRRRAAPVEPARHEVASLPLEEPVAAPPAGTAADEPEVVVEPAGSETMPPEPDSPPAAEGPVAPAELDEPGVSRRADADESPVTEPAGPGDAATDEPETSPRPAPRRRQQRPSVPSWDDIMFGAKRD